MMLVTYRAGSAPGPEAKIPVVSSGKFVTVDTEKDVPDQISGVAGQEAEHSVERDAFVSVSQLRL